jgi:tryptophan 2,3-dioxygenase
VNTDKDPQAQGASIRELESSVETDFRTKMGYADYLDLPRLLTAQHPLSKPEHHDELLFIIQHQTSELWLMLVLHELRAARAFMDSDTLGPALKCFARVKHIQRTLTEQWSVLATLTPREYAQFRDVLGNASGLQSHQYRAVEFILGNKNAAMLQVFESQPEVHAMLAETLAQPTVYDAFLAYLARAGYAIPDDVLNRDFRDPWTFRPELVPIFQEIYESASSPWDVYEACESLVDVEDNFHAWRFRHLRTVQRTIGFKTGTGGSSGVAFLRRALDLVFFPELFAVRTEVGR